jgi:DNA-binding transcriptional regulator LsrR (DeoR family)
MAGVAKAQRLMGADRDAVAALIRKMYEDERLSLWSIAVRLEMSHRTVYRLALEAGTVMRPRASAGVRIESFNGMPRAGMAAQVARLYQDEGKGLRTIAGEVGLSYGTVRNLAKEAGVTMRPPIRPDDSR